MSEATKARNFAFILYPESLPEDWQTKLTVVGRPVAISPLHDKDKAERKSADAMRKEAERRAKNQCGKIENPMDREEAISKAREYWLGVVRQEQDALPEFKKPHYHVLYVAANPVTKNSVRNKIQRALCKEAISHVEIVDNVRNYYLYLTHESIDAIEKGKHKYDKSSIVLLNDFDLDRYITLDKEQKSDLCDAVIGLIRKYKIMNMVHLVDMIEEHGTSIGVTTVKQLRDVISGELGFIKTLMDGYYQIWSRHRYAVPESTYDPETGEIQDDSVALSSHKRGTNPGQVWRGDSETP